MKLPLNAREVAIGIALLLSFGATRAQAQSGLNPACKNFGLVSEWKGSLSLVGTGSGTLSDGGTYSINESITASPDLNLQGAPTWTGTFNETIHIDDMESHPDGTFTHITDDETLKAGPHLSAAGLPGAGLSIDFTQCNFQFNWDPSFHETITTETGTETGTPDQYGWVGAQQNVPFVLGAGAIQGPLPTSGLAIPGSASFSYFSVLLGDPANWTMTWSLNPVLDLDLVVTIPEYSTWRPTAGLTEADTGSDASGQPNLLAIQALLVTKSTQKPTDFPPDNLTFLLASSHEPGVTMNWPPKNQLVQPTPADLSFDKKQSQNANFTISTDGTQAQITPTTPPVVAPVTIVLSPHDWGGWATLNVTATVDGQQIQGHFKNDPTTDILLPKRQPGLHVADIWKSQHSLALTTADTDDSETDPAGKPGCVGDGFTLYEEYRGFIENRKHIEGDPTTKDFFILNDIGADAEPGIFLFTSTTGLTVHKDLRYDEAQTTNRPEQEITGLEITPNGTTRILSPIAGRPLINFNHNQAVIETNQYGVLLRTCTEVYLPNPDSLFGADSLFSGDGAITFYQNQSATANDEHPDHAHPAVDDFICIQLPDVPGTINPNNDHGTIKRVDAVLQYDIAIAHELSHSVGVSHHGDRLDEGKTIFTLRGKQDPLNPTGKDAFFYQGQMVRIIDEKTGEDQVNVAAKWLLDQVNECGPAVENPTLFSPAVVQACTDFFLSMEDPAHPGEIKPYFNFLYIVGLPQGKHSGDDQCWMRYPFAKLYPKIGDPTTYYAIPAGTEPVGAALCVSPAGTGVNASTHAPQSRFGDARSGRGACQSWVCVNDFYPTQADQQ